MEKHTIEVERKFVISDNFVSDIETLGATLSSSTKFTDTYYDTEIYVLCTHDHWLRKRENVWELKCPPSRKRSGTSSVQSYEEVTDVTRIIHRISKYLPTPPTENDSPEVKMATATDIEAFLLTSKCVPFASFDTNRSSYKLGELSIDLDIASFGYRVGEVEKLVSSEEDIGNAEREIDAFLERLGIEKNRIPGKMDMYLQENNQNLYAKLLANKLVV